MVETEIVARRRKWTAEEKAALLAEAEAEGGRVAVVAQRHGISDSLLYNWRSAWKAAVSMGALEPVEFVPLGVFERGSDEGPAMLAAQDPVPPKHASSEGRVGMIEIEQPSA